MKKIITSLLILVSSLGALHAQQACTITAAPNGTAGGAFSFSVAGTWSPNMNLILWNFGDGSWGYGPITSHNYTMNGTFIVQARIYLLPDTSNVVCISSAPVNVFGLVNSGCSIEAYVDSTGTGQVGFFANNVTAGASIAWNFGDGTTGTGSPVAHTYSQTGYYAVTMTAGTQGTTSFCTTTDSIYVPVSNAQGCDFSYYDNGSGQYGFYPLNPASNGSQYSISFGDGSTASNSNGQFIHTYSQPGMYTVSMTTSTANGSSCTSTMVVSVSMPPPPVGCPISYNVINATGDAYVFTVNSNSTYCFWTITQANGIMDSLMSQGSSISYVFPSSGVYAVSVQSYDSLGFVCTGNITVTVNSNNPAGCDITANGMIPGTTQTGFSVGTFPVSATWTVAQNGNILYTTTVSFSNQFAYSFPASGTYTIEVTTTDSMGIVCSSNINYNYNNNPPPPVNLCNAGFQSYTQALNAFFVETSGYNPANTNYFWNFGDGSSSTVRFPYHTYASAGIYNVTLYISNPICADTVIQSVYVSTQNIPDSCNAYFVVTQLSPNTLTVVSPAGNNSANSMTWNFNGVSSNAAFPTLTIPYNSTNIFCLTVGSPVCQSTYCDTVTLDSAGVLQRMASTAVQINVVSPQTLTGFTITTGIKTQVAEARCIPNPFSGQVSITNSGQAFRQYRVFSADGKLVDSGILRDEITLLDGSAWSSGVYIVHLSGPDAVSQNLRLIKE